MKRIICLLILLSMVLHSASRLGIISFLYQKRHTLAYNIGLIAEVPITICSENHSFSQDLVIHIQEDGEKLPPASFQAREIILFAQVISTDLVLLSDPAKGSHFTLFLEPDYQSPVLPTFHPPCEG